MKIDLTESQVEILVQILRSEISGEVEGVCIPIRIINHHVMDVRLEMLLAMKHCAMKIISGKMKQR